MLCIAVFSTKIVYTLVQKEKLQQFPPDFLAWTFWQKKWDEYFFIVLISVSFAELALITADFVKVYDLGKDVLSPQNFLLVPTGKIRDCTLAFMADGFRYVLIMSSAGHIHFQVSF